MKCIDEQQLWEYIDGEVAKTERVVLETHIDKCPECQKELDLLTTLDSEFSNILADKPSMRFTKNVMELIEIEINPAAYKPLLQAFWKRFAIVSFASMVLTLVVIALAFPVSGAVPFEAEFHAITGGISWLLSFSQEPLIFNSIAIVLAFWLLYGIDKYFLATQMAR